MNWVSSSLQLAGTLLESVDQHAALTLTGDEGSGDEEEHASSDEGLLSTLKSRISHATDAVSATASSIGDSADESELQTSDAPTSDADRDTQQTDGLLDAARVVRSPPSSTSSRRSTNWAAATPSPPRSSSSAAAASVSTDDECARLRKELARLKTDARAKDKALSAAQKRLRVCEDELEALANECAGRVADVHEQLARVREAKDADEQHFVHALALKDAQAQTAICELDALQQAKQLQADELAALRAQLAAATESKESEWTSAAAAAATGDGATTRVQALQAELNETLAAHARLRQSNDATRTSLLARQTQLERANAELATDVARLEREVASSRSRSDVSAAAAGASTFEAPVVPALSDDYRRVQQTLVATKKALNDALATRATQQQELQMVRDELQRTKQTLELSEQRAAEAQYVAQREADTLRSQLSAAASSHSGAAATDARIHTLTDRLVAKQEALDALRSKAATLELRLVDALSRSQQAEARAAELERNGGVLDVEMAVPVGSRRTGVHTRPNRMAHLISRVAPVVERSRRVVSALDVLDRWLLFLGRVFLRFPFARLGLLCYVALVHCWVFVILSFHTSHLSEEMQTQHAGAAAADDDQLFPSH